MSLDNIVNVSITRETAAVSQTGFGTLLVLGDSDSFPKVDTVTIVFDADLITDNSIVVTVNGVALSPVVFASSHANTMGLLETALEAHANIDTVTVDTRTLTIVSESDLSVVIQSAIVTLGVSQAVATITRTAATRIQFYANPTAVLVDFSATDLEYLAALAAFSQSPRPTQVAIGQMRSGDASWTAALAAIVLESNEWYGLVITSRTEADVLEAAAWTEAVTKLFLTATADAVMLTTATTAIDGQLAALDYDRSGCMYHPDADASTNDPYPDAAWFGRMLTTIPGSATWMFKTLSGVPVTVLTTTQKSNVHTKLGNTYTSVGGQSITEKGTVASGEFLDVMRGVDWIEARIQESIYSLLVNSAKVPFTDAGIEAIIGEIKAVLERGILNGLIARDPAYTVTAPDAADVSTNDKALRQLPDVEFTATLAGAIHKVTIAGTVTV